MKVYYEKTEVIENIDGIESRTILFERVEEPELFDGLNAAVSKITNVARGLIEYLRPMTKKEIEDYEKRNAQK